MWGGMCNRSEGGEEEDVKCDQEGGEGGRGEGGRGERERKRREYVRESLLGFFAISCVRIFTTHCCGWLKAAFLSGTPY